eukprot:g22776.t1
MQRTQRSASEMPPPGPMSVPILGSVSVLWALIRGKSLLQVLSDQRKKFGSLFLLKFGPSKQVWVGNA